MLEIKGKYNNAKVFTDNVEQEAISQIYNLCNQDFCKDSKIRIMPDVHAGAGCTIGTTMTIEDKVVPNLVGVDIGCGMLTVELGDIEIDLKELDSYIREYIPSGQNVHTSKTRYSVHQQRRAELWGEHLLSLYYANHINVDRAINSIGTLGGGNHFLEIAKDDEGKKYLVIHSGSRYLGKQVAEYYQDLAYKTLSDNKDEIKKTINKLKSEGRHSEISSEIKKIQVQSISKDLAYLEGENLVKYLYDMILVQYYAQYNRFEMWMAISNFLKLDNKDALKANVFTTTHNYIDVGSMILRKGAISAKEGEKVLIPINMRDGSIIAIGKGNEDWNYSAPHGAGRLMSRRTAKDTLALDEFKQSMDGIFTTSVNASTIDESPMAYKPIDEIINNIQDTVDIVKIIKPIYNFKSSN